MLLHGGKQRAYVRAIGDKLDEAVELRTTLLTVDAAVRMDFKNTVYQLAQMIVHSYTHLAVYDLDEQLSSNLTCPACFERVRPRGHVALLHDYMPDSLRQHKTLGLWLQMRRTHGIAERMQFDFSLFAISLAEWV
jgi:hypothetical protein